MSAGVQFEVSSNEAGAQRSKASNHISTRNITAPRGHLLEDAGRGRMADILVHYMACRDVAVVVVCEPQELG